MIFIRKAKLTKLGMASERIQPEPSLSWVRTKRSEQKQVSLEKKKNTISYS
jgi:hypothetical protein